MRCWATGCRRTDWQKRTGRGREFQRQLVRCQVAHRFTHLQLIAAAADVGRIHQQARPDLILESGGELEDVRDATALVVGGDCVARLRRQPE